jgi:CBS domain-containing membrane protein
MIRLRDIMTRDVLTVPPTLSVREAAELFATERLGGAPVVRGGKMIGMLSASDLLDFVASLQAEPLEVGGDTSERGILDSHTVEEAMTRGPVRSLPPDAPATRAAEVMKEERIHRLPVVDGETLVGIVSTVDLVRAVADRRLSHRTFVFPKRSAID